MRYHARPRSVQDWGVGNRWSRSKQAGPTLVAMLHLTILCIYFPLHFRTPSSYLWCSSLPQNPLPSPTIRTPSFGPLLPPMNSDPYLHHITSFPDSPFPFPLHIPTRSSPTTWPLHPPQTNHPSLVQVIKILWTWRFMFPVSKSMVAPTSVTMERSSVLLNKPSAASPVSTRIRSSCIRKTSLSLSNFVAWMTATTFSKKKSCFTNPRQPLFRTVATTQKISMDHLSTPSNPLLVPHPFPNPSLPTKDPLIRALFHNKNKRHQTNHPSMSPASLRVPVSITMDENKKKVSVKRHEHSSSKKPSWYVWLGRKRGSKRSSSSHTQPNLPKMFRKSQTLLKIKGESGWNAGSGIEGGNSAEALFTNLKRAMRSDLNLYLKHNRLLSAKLHIHWYFFLFFLRI